MLVTCLTMGLAEWIIDDTYLVPNHLQIWKHLNAKNHVTAKLIAFSIKRFSHQWSCLYKSKHKLNVIAIDLLYLSNKYMYYVVNIISYTMLSVRVSICPQITI